EEGMRLGTREMLNGGLRPVKPRFDVTPVAEKGADKGEPGVDVPELVQIVAPLGEGEPADCHVARLPEAALPEVGRGQTGVALGHLVWIVERGGQRAGLFEQRDPLTQRVAPRQEVAECAHGGDDEPRISKLLSQPEGTAAVGDTLS